VPSLNHGSLLIVSHNLDELTEFSRNFPLNSINRSRPLSCYPVLIPGNYDIARWRENFASRALRTWETGGDVWISNRLFNRMPKSDWNWVEGDDNRVSWSDLSPFFSQLWYGGSIGGNDGFILLLPSIDNQKLLSSVDALTPKEVTLLPAPTNGAQQ
jgi:hypothetical protein